VSALVERVFLRLALMLLNNVRHEGWCDVWEDGIESPEFACDCGLAHARDHLARRLSEVRP
jgi:hypothetical protein